MPCRLAVRFAALLAGALVLHAASAQAAVELAPHRAVYELDLAVARGSQPVATVDGAMEFEWKDVCDGWTVRHRARMDLVYAEGGEAAIGWSFNAWESDDGLRYRFFIRRFRNGEQTEEVRGEARLQGEGSAGVARYTEPEKRQVSLPAGTLFPTRHTEVLIDKAEAGELPLWRQVFDGSGEDGGLYGVNAALVEALGPKTAPGFDSPLVAGRRSWRINMAFFNAEQQGPTPVHEQSLRLFENGVVNELLLDYGDFVLRAKLSELDGLERPDC